MKLRDLKGVDLSEEQNIALCDYDNEPMRTSLTVREFFQHHLFCIGGSGNKCRDDDIYVIFDWELFTRCGLKLDDKFAFVSAFRSIKPEEIVKEGLCVTLNHDDYMIVIYKDGQELGQLYVSTRGALYHCELNVGDFNGCMGSSPNGDDSERITVDGVNWTVRD